MTDAKGATAPGILRKFVDSSDVTHSEWLWLAEWLERHAEASQILRRRTDTLKFMMASAGCRLLHEQTRESGDG